MADQTVRIENTEPVAATAKILALDIWYASGKDAPTIDDSAEFLTLVASCAYALSGRRSSTMPK